MEMSSLHPASEVAAGLSLPIHLISLSPEVDDQSQESIETRLHVLLTTDSGANVAEIAWLITRRLYFMPGECSAESLTGDGGEGRIGVAMATSTRSQRRDDETPE